MNEIKKLKNHFASLKNQMKILDSIVGLVEANHYQQIEREIIAIQNEFPNLLPTFEGHRFVIINPYWNNPRYETKSLQAYLSQAIPIIENEILEKETKTSGSDELDQNFYAIHPNIKSKCLSLYQKKEYAEAVEKSFKVVKDKLRVLTGYEKASEAFGKGKLHIKGAAATNVDNDFNKASQFLMMAIDMFKNEKGHTSDAKIDDPIRAYQYLVLSSLALYLLENSEITPDPTPIKMPSGKIA
ncbi:MAG: TIGR02391 family protein [Candidatus Azambacteria bacterium]|nr:TIGR02391 family protein [Candidatus Azambacteria bacterium]